MEILSREALSTSMRIKGYTFELTNSDNDLYYDCRGEVEYDDDHDPRPEQGLISAAYELERQLTEGGADCSVEEGEKGWVEVQIFSL